MSPRRSTCRLIATLLPLAAVAAAPVATAPSTRAAEKEMIEFADGAMAMPVPNGWDLTVLGSNGLSAQLVTAPDAAKGGLMVVSLTPQERGMTEHPQVAEAMGKAILEQIRKSVQAGGSEVLTAPHLERDPDWFVRIREVTRDPKSGKVADRLHLYRPVGVYLTMVVVTAYDPPAPADAKAVHAVGETALYQLRPAKAQRNAGVLTKGQPTVLRKAKLRLMPPTGWLETRSDVEDGVAVVYRRTLGATLVAVRAVPLDKVPGDKAQALERVAREELARHLPEGTEPQGDPEKVEGGAFELRMKQPATFHRQRHRVETRVRTLGEPAAGLQIVAVTNASLESRAEDASKFADDLATSAELFKPR